MRKELKKMLIGKLGKDKFEKEIAKEQKTGIPTIQALINLAERYNIVEEKGKILSGIFVGSTRDGKTWRAFSKKHGLLFLIPPDSAIARGEPELFTPITCKGKIRKYEISGREEFVASRIENDKGMSLTEMLSEIPGTAMLDEWGIFHGNLALVAKIKDKAILSEAGVSCRIRLMVESDAGRVFSSGFLSNENDLVSIASSEEERQELQELLEKDQDSWLATAELYTGNRELRIPGADLIFMGVTQQNGEWEGRPQYQSRIIWMINTEYLEEKAYGEEVVEFTEEETKEETKDKDEDEAGKDVVEKKEEVAEGGKEEEKGEEETEKTIKDIILSIAEVPRKPKEFVTKAKENGIDPQVMGQELNILWKDGTLDYNQKDKTYVVASK